MSKTKYSEAKSSTKQTPQSFKYKNTGLNKQHVTCAGNMSHYEGFFKIELLFSNLSSQKLPN